ncbi:MAG: putative rhamnosyl transferase [Bacteroidales bacterium]|nr:putative rhamnosyl transferase [Bacteroidales bacterium]
MNSFHHFLLTRFNIPQRDVYPKDKNDNAIDESWLIDRINLFDIYCFPSICSQVCKDFDWLVFFDKDSPRFLKDKIVIWRQECPQFFPIYVSDYDEFMRFSMNDAICKMMGNVDFVITTRLDNDDALLDKAILEIQSSFVPCNNTIIDFENGFCYDRGKRILCYVKNNISNQFISLIENKEEVRTVFFYNHRKWVGNAEYIKIKLPLWLEIVHERNLLNKITGKALFKVKEDLKLFDLNISFVSTFLYAIGGNIIGVARVLKKIVLGKS